MPPTIYKKQREILDFISQYIQLHGYSPTLREIAESSGVSSLATIHEHLTSLENKGLLKRFTGAVRGLEITEPLVSSSMSSMELPLVGRIAAGRPIEAIEDLTETITIPPSMVTGKKRAFALQVRGDSMIEAGILDGDYVVIEQTETAENGEIVVALLENEFATLKRYYKEKDRIRLEPANSTMSPIYVDKVKIQGKVRGIIRRYS